MQQIAIVNETTVVTDDQVKQVMAALQIQLSDYLHPVWNVGPYELSFLPKGQAPVQFQWELVFADDSPQADALGYHELTQNDDPIGYVFVKTTLADGVSWSVTASHEIMEMVIDPQINSIVEVDNADGSYAFYAKEVGDAVEDDSFGYEIALPDGSKVLVSDFVTPNWFDPSAVPQEKGRKYDLMGHCSKPFQLLKNGYISILNVAAGPQWSQINGELVGKTEAQAAPAPLHRRHRRALGQHNWKRSEPRKAE